MEFDKLKLYVGRVIVSFCFVLCLLYLTFVDT